MKKLHILLFSLLVSSMVSAQDFTLAHSTGKIIIEEVDEVTIKGYSGSEIVISGHKDEEADERAAGLKLLNSQGLDDNTGFGVSVREEGDNVHVTGIGNADDSRITIQLPKNMAVYYSHTDYHGGDLVIEDVAGEIEVSAAHNEVHLKNVTGPMAVKSLYGEIEAVFSSVNQSGSISLNSVYNLIDATFPSSSGYNVNMSTPYGSIYTDVSIDVDTGDDEMKRISNKKIKGTVNGGGVDVTLKSGYENIYLRKG